MPWKATCAMDERMRFVIAASAEDAVMVEVCERFGVSRMTGYKWLARYRQDGVEGLKERSRAPLQHGLARPEAMIAAVLGLRERYPFWGPRKLRKKLAHAIGGHHYIETVWGRGYILQDPAIRSARTAAGIDWEGAVGPAVIG